MRDKRAWKRILQIAGLTFIAAPLNVLFHELAHMLALTLSGIPSTLVSLGGMTPIGFQWTFESLRDAQVYYGTGSAAIVAGALAGPLYTLFVGYAGLFAFWRWHHLVWWALAYSAVGTRSVVNLLFQTPKVIDGSINSSDEAIPRLAGVGFLVAPYHRGYLYGITHLRAAPARTITHGNRRVHRKLCRIFIIEYVVNTQVFHLTSWDR